MKRLVALSVLFGVFAAISVVAQESPRIVTVTALVDSSENPRMISKLLNNVFYLASKAFQKEFNIKLKLVRFNIGLWRSPSDNFDGNLELFRLKQIVPQKSDIIIAFTTKNFFRNEAVEVDGESVVIEKRLGGIAMILGNHTIVKLENKTELILIHELGHIFGADHSLDPNSIMNAEGIRTSVFDKTSKEVIRANRNRKF